MLARHWHICESERRAVKFQSENIKNFFSLSILLYSKIRPQSPQNENWTRIVLLFGQFSWARVVLPCFSQTTHTKHRREVQLIKIDISISREIVDDRKEREKKEIKTHSHDTNSLRNLTKWRASLSARACSALLLWEHFDRVKVIRKRDWNNSLHFTFQFISRKSDF